ANVSPSGGSTTYHMDSGVTKGIAGGSSVAIDTTAQNNSEDRYTAFSVLSALTLASAYASQIGTSGKMPSQIDARFSPKETGTHPNTGTTVIDVLQQDRWDWDVIGHEYGHYVEDLDGFAVPPVISYRHNFGLNESETNGKGNGTVIAFDEGWATFFSIEA